MKNPWHRAGLWLVLVMLVAVFGCQEAPQQWASPSTMGMIKIEGSGVEVVQNGQPPTTSAPYAFEVKPGTTIKVNQSGRLVYPCGGQIEIKGKGLLTLGAQGFTTRDGTFLSSFRVGKRGLEVRVPGALMGIRGTSIRFQLRLGKGEVELMEGNVEVTPVNGQPFDWKAGDTLSVADDEVRAKAAQPKPTAVSAPPADASQPPVATPAGSKPAAGHSTGGFDPSSLPSTFDQ